jgi:hypothetical protein
MTKIMLIVTLRVFMLLTCFAYGSFAQVPEPDKSPMDISYAPQNYPILKFQDKQPVTMPLARVIYSRPQKNGRQLFGNEIRYNVLWRLGANEATEIELFKNANISGRPVAKGRYTLFCIPNADNWTLVFSKDNYSWGAFSYKQANDVARVSVPVTRPTGQMAEYFTMFFNESNHLVIMWDDVRVVVPILFPIK